MDHKNGTTDIDFDSYSFNVGAGPFPSMIPAKAVWEIPSPDFVAAGVHFGSAKVALIGGKIKGTEYHTIESTPALGLTFDMNVPMVVKLGNVKALGFEYWVGSDSARTAAGMWGGGAGLDGFVLKRGRRQFFGLINCGFTTTLTLAPLGGKPVFMTVDNIQTARDLCPNDENKTVPGDCGCGVAEDDCEESCPIKFLPRLFCPFRNK